MYMYSLCSSRFKFLPGFLMCNWNISLLCASLIEFLRNSFHDTTTLTSDFTHVNLLGITNKKRYV